MQEMQKLLRICSDLCAGPKIQTLHRGVYAAEVLQTVGMTPGRRFCVSSAHAVLQVDNLKMQTSVKLQTCNARSC